MQKSLYEILGVDETASQEEIQRLYEDLRSRLRARADRGDGEAANHLKFATEAFSTLRDPESRRSYDARLASGRATAPRRAPTIDAEPVSGSDLESDGDQVAPHRAFRRLRANLRHHPTTIVVSLLVSIGMGVGWWLMRPTEEDRLEHRANAYLTQFKRLNFEAAYDYLTPDLRELVSREAYVQSRSAELGVNARIVDVEVTVPAQTGYVVVETGQGRTRINWVYREGEWYRDLASDRSGMVDHLLAVSKRVEVRNALPVPLGLWDVRTRWNRNQTRIRAGTTKYLVFPVTAFHVVNEGNAEIDYLDVMVEYYDTEAGVLFGTVSGNLLGYADAPLTPRRKVRWISGDLNLRYEVDFGEWAETLKNQPVMVEGDNPVIDRIEVRIYARQEPKAPWTRLQ
jgi:curved DNA-binding protein CbpA